MFFYSGLLLRENLYYLEKKIDTGIILQFWFF